MFNFSSKTIVNKEFKILDILRQIKAEKEVKDDAKKINSITLSNIIKAETINCNENEKYKEIYIFKINLNTIEIPEKFITNLDKSIRFHTYFVFEHFDKIASMMCFKEVGRNVKLGTYYSHPFYCDEEIEIPILNNVEDFYKFLYSYETRIKYKLDESAEDFYKRVNVIKRLDYQISRTEKAIQYEVQPRKKYEYHTRLVKYKKEREKLLEED